MSDKDADDLKEREAMEQANAERRRKAQAGEKLDDPEDKDPK